MKEKTIKLSDYFGEKEYTLKEFKKRWSSPVNEIWAFLIDHGSAEERAFGQKLAEKIFHSWQRKPGAWPGSFRRQ